MRISFSEQAKKYLPHYAQMPERELFYYLINADEFPAVSAYAQQLVTRHLEQAQALLANNSPLPQHLQPFDYSPALFAERMQTLYQHQLQTITAARQQSPDLSREQINYLLKQQAPAALTEGCWLQNISLAANNHTPVSTHLFRIYAEKIGDGNAFQHCHNRYQRLLSSAHITLPEINSRLFTTSTEIGDTAFSAPVFQLALSLFPRVYLPELIGFTLGHYFHTPDYLLRSLSGQLQQQGLDGAYCQANQLPEQPGEMARTTLDVVDLYLAECSDEAQRQSVWQRLWAGLVAQYVINQRWQADLQDAVNRPRVPTPHQKMLALLAAKVPHARNMHRNRKIGGQLINDWFAQEPFNAEAFLQALAASPFVNLKEPAKSALITRSINFGGPMFRIFTEAEQAVMSEWIHSLAKAAAAAQATPTAPTLSAPPVRATDPALPTDLASTPAMADRAGATRPGMTVIARDDKADLATYAKCSKRELYHYFVNADLYPNVLPTARRVAEQFFKQARAGMNKRKLDAQLQFFPYSHAAFEERVSAIYTRELDAYEAFVPPSTVPREIMVWFVWQYAPFPMVDGSWVQHIAKAGMSHTEISARLFRIYSDEVGNGDTVLNHPNVYRKMLESEGIRMPATDSLEFALQPEIKDFAFDLPLLTLSVSLFPKAFLPEIIGVNLAIELSGLGKGYMQIIDELKYWKIDPYFFTLHLTIDNIASGHTAVAMETVHLYLDQILATQGEQAMQREWERIWVGYLAFRQHMTRFDATLERQASLRFLIPLIKLRMVRGKEKKPAVGKAA